MKVRATILLLMNMVFGCAATSSSTSPQAVPPGVTFAGGDGSNCEHRVLILGTNNGFAGLTAEYAWLDRRYPGFTMRSQALLICDGVHADEMSITAADGRDVKVYFEVEAFFGANQNHDAVTTPSPPH